MISSGTASESGGFLLVGDGNHVLYVLCVEDCGAEAFGDVASSIEETRTVSNELVGW